MGAEKLSGLWRRWRAESLLYCLLLALAAGVLLTTVAHVGLGWSLWMGVLVFAGCFCLALALFPFWRIRLTDVASYLNRQLPELEESCGLLLRPSGELGVLERLQVSRVEGRLDAAVLPRPLFGRLLWALGWVAVATVVSVGINWVGAQRVSRGTVALESGGRVVHETAAPGIRGVTVRIVPPAYTGRALRSQPGFTLQVEEGSQLNWELVTTSAVDTVAFIFNDTTVKTLQPVDGSRTRWNLTQMAQHPGFYQVRVGKQLSGLYPLEIIRDEPPVIRVMRPAPYTLIDYGEPTRIGLQVQLLDDYGIRNASVMATVSSGKGEAVKFKEQELHWNQNFTGERRYALSRVLDLGAMGLKPGDELYFYCEAIDTHGQEARSDMYIVVLADTAQLMSLAGMTLSTDVKPEFFRSERQIIIETEQLLRAKDTIAVQAFKDKSNDLGIDQKLLRLRYGKFLGEEAEEGERGGDTVDFGKFGDATKILETYTDKHDNAEDATFLEPAVKAQLRATLSEMWKAELQFRIYKPHEALPYCYKALRLLKDLQQQSRAYVAKTGMKLTPLNPAKRLTGELGAIAPPGQKIARPGALPADEVMRLGLAVLEGMRRGMSRGEGGRVLLGQIEHRLAGEAAAKPGKYLEAYEAMKRVETGGAVEHDLVIVEKAVAQLLPPAETEPVAPRVAPDKGLSQLYFSYIK